MTNAAEVLSEIPAPALRVRFRAAADDDFAFVFATWLRGAWETRRTSGQPEALFFPSQHRAIEMALCRGARVRIAYPEGEPDVILGYLVTERDDAVLHWLYVKMPFRQCGVATALLSQASFPVAVKYTHKTADARHILRRLPSPVYHPHGLFGL